jgi:hypothetical protein
MQVACAVHCLWLQVLNAGTYDTTIFYTSAINATFTLTAGSWQDILKNTAARTTANLPAQVSLTCNVPS